MKRFMLVCLAILATVLLVFAAPASGYEGLAWELDITDVKVLYPF
jgi:hypothetical protein